LKQIASKAWSYLQLTRFILSVSVGFTALVGFIKFNNSLPARAWFIFLGVTLLSGGASALNQLQERKYDARMKRTMKRPIPAGIIAVAEAAILSAILLASGLLILFYFGNLYSFLVALFSIAWYNFFYTYLKRTSAFAVFMGIFTGIAPVFIGWFAAGGGGFDISCLLIAAFMSAWQIPHFLLLMLHYEDDYRNAAFPLLTDRHSVRFVKMLIIISILIINIVVLMLLYFNIIGLLCLQIAAPAISVFLFTFCIYKLSGKTNFSQLLMAVNIYMMLIMIIILIDYLISSI
jgi:heme o synthase